LPSNETIGWTKVVKYYFLGTLLPALSFDVTPELSFAEVNTLFQDHLTPKDYDKVLSIRQFFDLQNLRALWLGETLDPRGALTPLDLEEAVAGQTGLPPYVYEFLDRYSKTEERLHHFPLLVAKFFQRAKSLTDPFLRDYLNFERELRLVLTAFRAHKLKRDLSVELQYENPEEELIAQLLAQKDAKSYEPPEKYRPLKVLFEKYGNDPLALQKAIDHYRFEAINDMVDGTDVFSVDHLLAYFLQLILVEKWFQFDKDKGIQMIDTLIKEKI
jgi:hypothetical protein